MRDKVYMFQAKNLAKMVKMKSLEEYKALKGFAEIIEYEDLRIALLKSELDYARTASESMKVLSMAEGMVPSNRTRLKERARQEMANARLYEVLLDSFERARAECLRNFEKAIDRYPEDWRKGFRMRFLEGKSYKQIREEIPNAGALVRKLRMMEGKDGLTAQHESEDARQKGVVH